GIRPGNCGLMIGAFLPCSILSGSLRKCIRLPAVLPRDLGCWLASLSPFRMGAMRRISIDLLAPVQRIWKRPRIRRTKHPIAGPDEVIGRDDVGGRIGHNAVPTV